MRTDVRRLSPVRPGHSHCRQESNPIYFQHRRDDILPGSLWTDILRLYRSQTSSSSCKLDLETNGPWPELERATEQVVNKIIPRLLGSLQTKITSNLLSVPTRWSPSWEFMDGCSPAIPIPDEIFFWQIRITSDLLSVSMSQFPFWEFMDGFSPPMVCSTEILFLQTQGSYSSYFQHRRADPHSNNLWTEGSRPRGHHVTDICNNCTFSLQARLWPKPLSIPTGSSHVWESEHQMEPAWW